MPRPSRPLLRHHALQRPGPQARRVRVDYELTDLGHSLSEMMKAVKNWAETHIEEVHEARERYDTEDAGVTAGAGAGVDAGPGAQK